MNLSPEEQYRLNGRIEGPACVELLDAAIRASAIDVGAFTDAKASYPDEDFLEDTITDIGYVYTLVKILRKNLRGVNRESADDILKAIDDLKSSVTDLQQSVHNSTEYGLSELGNIEKAIA